MDSDDDGFPKQGGEALEIGDDFDSEDGDGDDADAKQDAMRQPMKGNMASGGDAGKGAEAGADVKGHRIRIDEALLTHLLTTAPEQYTLSARNPERSVTLGGRKQILTPAYGAPNVLDLDGIRRNPTIKDFHDFAC